MAEPQIEAEDITVPTESIHGNTFDKNQARLTRSQLHTILTKRLQFSHLGDSTAPPDTNKTDLSAQNVVYHSLYQKKEPVNDSSARQKMVLERVFVNDGRRSELWRNKRPQISHVDENDIQEE